MVAASWSNWRGVHFKASLPPAGRAIGFGWLGLKQALLERFKRLEWITRLCFGATKMSNGLPKRSRPTRSASRPMLDKSYRVLVWQRPNGCDCRARAAISCNRQQVVSASRYMLQIAIRACGSVADIYSKTKRAEIMSLVRGRGNKSTELLTVTLFRKCGISGWRRHVPLTGRPDFVFKAARVAVFIDGCFWHMCPIHGTMPKANTRFWAAKLSANWARDRRVERMLRAKKWRVIRIWQHDLRQRPVASMRRVERALGRRFPRASGASQAG